MSKLSSKLKDKLNGIPDLPGIYKMLDSQGRIIYIGKSVSLRTRTRSYFTGGNKWSKVEKMVGLIEDIEYEVMDTNLEAMLEECKLIKELQPIFNSQFKNHRKYVYLKVEDYNIHNSLSIVYEREEDSYGPFRSRSILMDIIDSFKNLYPIIKVNDKYNFKYNLIPISMDLNTFNENKNNLNEIFSDENSLDLRIKELEEMMEESSLSLRFEMAAYFKNMIDNLNYIRYGIFKFKAIFNNHILLKLPIEGGYKLFYVTKGEIILKEKYRKLNDKDIDGFIKRGKDLVTENPKDIDEKASMDFHDILYSEINSSPDEMVMVL